VVAVDIKPTSCPNPVNVKSNGVLPVAILGTEQFDVTQVDPGTVRLAGVAPLRWAEDDVATPYDPYVGKEDAFDCTNDPADGYLDLTLKFAIQEVVAALGEVSDGEVVVLPLTANLKEEYGGTPVAGEDVVVILKKGTGEKVVRIEAHIDGRSQLILRGNTVQWHHLDFAAPGRHEFRNEPTIINNATWFPVWPDVPDEENRFCNCFSDVFKPVKPALPRQDISVNLNLLQSRDQTAIIQYPSEENGYTLIVEFDDNSFPGSDDYIVEVQLTR
jgi:hypothetical protein